MQLLAQKPVDAITIDELVNTAGVAKGSFFNHFADKTVFASAVADDIRAQLETRVCQFNEGIDDPLIRLSGGMIMSAAFALRERRRATVLVARSASSQALAEHPLNLGIVADMDMACGRSLVAREAERAGVQFWLGCCHMVMSGIVARPADQGHAANLLQDMVCMGLRGLAAATRDIDRLTSGGILVERLDAALHQFD